MTFAVPGNKEKRETYTTLLCVCEHHPSVGSSMVFKSLCVKDPMRRNLKEQRPPQTWAAGRAHLGRPPRPRAPPGPAPTLHPGSLQALAWMEMGAPPWESAGSSSLSQLAVATHPYSHC